MNTQPSDIRTATAYLILKKPKWRGDPPVIAGMRKEKPSLKPGEVAVKIKLNIDMVMFETFIPTVETTMHPGNVIEPEFALEVVQSDD